MRDACLDFSKSEIQMNEQKVANSGLMELTAAEIAEYKGDISFFIGFYVLRRINSGDANEYSDEMWAGDDPARGFGESSF
jgi:hypothetical protein